ncbi:MAG: DUF2177 family protein [Patescibacteria group bacterium]
MEFLKHYLVAAAVFVALDAVWLKFVANSFYKRELGGLLAKKPNFVAAAVFYLLYIVGIIVFVVNPALDGESAAWALGHGALLGLLMYATYDLTNHATLKNWPAKITYVDMAWGTFATATVSTITYLSVS